MPTLPWVGGFFKPTGNYPDLDAEKNIPEMEGADTDSFTMSAPAAENLDKFGHSNNNL